MSKWTKTTLGKIADIITGPFGSQLHQSDYVKRGIPIVMPQDIGNRNINYSSINYVSEEDATRLKRYSTVANDILYARRGDVEKHAFVRAKDAGVLCGTGCLRVRINSNEVEPAFLSFYLNREETRKWLVTHAVGTNMPNLNTDILSDVPIAYPTLKEQRKIVKVLNCLEERIVLNEKINDNLEQQAKLIYDYWFTQFDFPDENGKPYCSSGGKMVWNAQLKRNIPENWNVVPLLKLVSWESNSQPPKSEFVYEPKEGYVRFIQNRDYDSDTHITYIPRTKNLSIVDRFDILMDKYGDAGAVRYGIEGAFNVALGKICVHNPNYREYIRSFLGSDGIYKFLHNSCMASTRASLSEANLAILNVVVPDEKIILDYENFLHKIRVSILKNKDETVELINLRDWLLPMLMNGQATIAD